jgi:peptidoglycan hydrolase CwlO-like protein
MLTLIKWKTPLFYQFQKLWQVIRGALLSLPVIITAVLSAVMLIVLMGLYVSEMRKVAVLKTELSGVQNELFGVKNKLKIAQDTVEAKEGEIQKLRTAVEEKDKLTTELEDELEKAEETIIELEKKQSLNEPTVTSQQLTSGNL